MMASAFPELSCWGDQVGAEGIHEVSVGEILASLPGAAMGQFQGSTED